MFPTARTRTGAGSGTWRRSASCGPTVVLAPMPSVYGQPRVAPLSGRYIGEGMMVSAIVPTHDRPGVLRRCLETLQAQNVDPEQLEVVVVDDGSEADIAAIVDQVATGGPIAMRCERQALGGLNLARNRGIQISSGDVLAFLDDDTLVATGWARALTDVFAQPACAGVGGREIGRA